LVSLIPSSFESSQNSTLDEQGNYLNPSLGIGFQVPEGWIVQEPKKTQLDAPDIAIVGPYSGEFTPSISFIVEKANGTLLNDYFENKKSQIIKNAQSQNVSFLSEQDSAINGYNAKIVIIKEDFTEQGQSKEIKFKQAFVLANDNFYTITYANEEKNFNASLSNYDSLLNSIAFTNSQNSLGTGLWLPIGGIGAAIAIGMMLVIKKKRS
jgi:peptidyl-prolyl cis-trans isomerase B (cyclophilin B)